MVFEEVMKITDKGAVKTVGTAVKNSDSLRCSDLWLRAGWAVSAWNTNQRGVFRHRRNHTWHVQTEKVDEGVQKKHCRLKTLTNFECFDNNFKK